MPKITIITTTYKHQDFIAQTIESILAQTYTDWELLIGDDSPDSATWNIIQTYVAKYPKKIKARHHKPNKGIVENMNFLINKISSESVYVGFLEGDDIYTPNNIQEKVAVLEKYHDVGLVHSNYKIIDSQGSITSGSNKNIPGKYKYTLKEFFLNGPQIQSFGSVVVRKKIFEKYRPQNPGKKLKMFGPRDYWNWLNIVPNTHIFYIPNCLFMYRIHQNNFSKNLCTMYEQFNIIYDDVMKKVTDPEIINICRCLTCKNIGTIHLFRHRRRRAIKAILGSFQYYIRIDIQERLYLVILSLLPYKLFDILFGFFKRG